MTEYINFSKKNNYITNYNNKIIPSNPQVGFSLKNISTAINSYSDLQSSKTNNEKIEFSINNNRLVYNTTNNYYRKKNYGKFLNFPKSGLSSTCEDINNNSYFKKKTFNKINYKINLNSNLDNKITLNVKELLDITEKRNNIIQKKKKLEQIKKEQLLEEERKLIEILSENIHKDKNININTLCEDGVQTSSYKNIIKEKKEESILTESGENNENIFKDSKNNNNLNIENSKDLCNGDTDLVNIGNITEETIFNDNSNKNFINAYNENSNNNELNFIIENNDIIPSNNNEEDALTFENTFNNKECDCISKSSSSLRDYEKSKFKSYNRNKMNIQNETKSGSLNNGSVYTNFEKNKKEKNICEEKQNNNNNNKNIYNSIKAEKGRHMHKINNNLKNSINNNNSKDTNISNNYNILKNSKNINHKKNINSCSNRFNKNIIINRKIINMSKKIILSSNLKENSYIKNNNNFRTDGFTKKNYSCINIREKTVNNNNISKKNKIIILPNVNHLNGSKSFNKNKKKRQLDKYADYYKLRNKSRENSYNKNNIE